MRAPLPPSPVTDLETRQDDILRQLDELNLRIEATIKQFAPARPAEASRVADEPAPLKRAA